VTRARIFVVMLVSFFGLFGSRAHASLEGDFWGWFQRNEADLFEFERDQEAIFDRLATEMHKVHPSLTFEFGPKENDRREFVISADGIKDAFPKVESLYASAPAMAHWKFVKFRPRREPFDINYADISVKADTVSVLLEPDGQKVGLTVFIPGYDQENHNAYAGIAFLLLDQALGEYDVETRVGYIEVKDSSHAPAQARSLHEMPKAFDDLFTGR
jgi:hypothetical protein